MRSRTAGTESEETLPVVVIGAGPTGLATAAGLGRRGVPAVVLEQGDGVGAAWRGRYRGLRLNSGRTFSGLPGMRMPRQAGTFPGRDDVIAYLEAYSAAAGIDVRTGVRVRRVTHDRGQWRVVTDHGDRRTGEVVVATGLLSRGCVPSEWGAERSSIRALHSTGYGDPAPFTGCDVLVAGAGSSGLEIAHDLARGGARSVWLSVRRPPNILPRAVAGMPGDPAVHLLRRLPPRVADAAVRPLQRRTIGDLTDVGLPAPDEGPFTRQRRPLDAGPAIVDREVVDDLRAGRIRVVAAVERLSRDRVHLADGSSLRVDAVIAATGLRPGLEPLVGDLDVLDGDGLPVAQDEQPALPGLRFVNFGMRPGLLVAAGQRARRTAIAISREYRERDDEAERPRWLARRPGTV
ncbi:NAD(P)/FAD-dependent oxidoreductase [Blastococcus sp. MG754426]|uniref:flavin-containing monooxygenase n=1 Tax=unclassified Blastococcus TaxID=2619396 RepID=UPI001EF15DFE|nr:MULTISPECIES: NAD(P)/FAD-dependent oxidoreductase [unclassified Blastococcus]MCF6506319.1 NAD(P)/FAD-dependent oxidoreductase [Blastococcus sp. MG754426]MCF6510865.1 NAD(P)/FAD-dependent oxidoreductase [Blastococcus sp. MG754427]